MEQLFYFPFPIIGFASFWKKSLATAIDLSGKCQNRVKIAENTYNNTNVATYTTSSFPFVLLSGCCNFDIRKIQFLFFSHLFNNVICSLYFLKHRNYWSSLLVSLCIQYFFKALCGSILLMLRMTNWHRGLTDHAGRLASLFENRGQCALSKDELLLQTWYLKYNWSIPGYTSESTYLSCLLTFLPCLSVSHS